MEQEVQKIVKIRKIEPNKNQPRKVFEDESLKELSESIRSYGVIQPIVVHSKGSGYEIIAGERRWRAARQAGLREIPVIIKDYSEQEAAEVALIENVQRENLNPIEEAQAYQKLIQEYGMTQEELAKKVGKSRSLISNAVRFLKLPDEVKSLLEKGQISEGHAKVLLSVSSPEKQQQLAEKIIEENWSVRQLERILKQEKENLKKNIQDELEKKQNQKKMAMANQELYTELAEKINTKVGTKVTIARKTETKGKIEIDYYSLEDLERISEILLK
ncbi:MAG: ParB/RepB/Spo0J family partition protein [Lachnospiraceae bacterium]